MAGEMVQLIRAAEAALAAQEADLLNKLERERSAVYAQSATGTGHMSQKFSLDTDFRLVYVRCHFAGPTGTAPLVISVASRLGVDYNVVVRSLTAGVNFDTYQASFATIQKDPSPYAFAAGDELLFAWTNPSPGNIKWGLEVGLSLSTRPGAGI